MKQTSENVKNVDLFLYCVEKCSKKYRPEVMDLLNKVVDKLGTEIWKKAMIVLTFANEVKPNSSDNDSPKEYFEAKTKQFTNHYQEYLKSRGVNFDVPCTPAGDIKRQELPTCKDWLPVFWLMAFNRRQSAVSFLRRSFVTYSSKSSFCLFCL